MKNSMTNLGLIEETAEYKIFQARFKDTIQIFRQWKNSDLIEIKLGDEFAKAHGYSSITNMIDNEPTIRYQINMYCGGIAPQWIRVSEHGFMIKTKMTAN